MKFHVNIANSVVFVCIIGVYSGERVGLFDMNFIRSVAPKLTSITPDDILDTVYAESRVHCASVCTSRNGDCKSFLYRQSEY